MLSEDLRVGFAMPCCATPCPQGGQSREGRAVPCWAVGSCAEGRGTSTASLPTDTLDIQIHPRVDKPLYFTSCGAALANTPL